MHRPVLQVTSRKLEKRMGILRGDSSRMQMLALLGTAVIWAASFIFVKISLDEIGPFNLTFYRFLVATPVLFAILKAKGKIVPVSKKDFP